MIFQGDENDPELAYRDIAKFNIVQVAGKSVELQWSQFHCMKVIYDL